MSSAIEIRDLSFRYPGCPDAVFEHADLTVDEGSFAVLSGPTGSGKTTLLRLLKPEIAPAGRLSGERRIFGCTLEIMDLRTSAENIAFVFQDPENQIVCDTVWHELAFGLENLGVPTDEMRLRVAETCSYLGIGPWFRMRCEELSGGQQQVLALAAALTMRPRILLLDEPTSMLDPVAEKAFLALLFRANRELGITVVVATHRADAYRAYATRAFQIDAGKLREVPLGSLVAEKRSPMGTAPLSSDRPVRLSDVWFRYRRDGAWVLRGFDLALPYGEITALTGGNGSGKSTVLALIAGMLDPRRGTRANSLSNAQAYLPQNPKALLTRESVGEELAAWAPSCGYGEDEIAAALERIGIADKRSSHPYDLSGGQQQLLALEKLLITRPELLLLDEPIKGLDAASADRAAERLAEARSGGATILIATHDHAFVHRMASSVTLLFDGQAAATLPCDAFFSRSWLFGAR